MLKNKLLLVVTLVLAQTFTMTVAAAPRLNGLSVHSELGKESFIAALFAETLSDNARSILISNEDKRVQVRIIADRVSARSFKRMWIEGMAINASSEELTENAQYMADFSNMIKIKLTKGDIFTIERSSDSVNVVLNGISLGQINSPGFFDLLLRTWIGPVPLSSDFRDSLLSAGNLDPALLARFDATVPTDERIAAVERVIKSRPTPEPKIAAVPPVQSNPKPKVTVVAPVVPALPVKAPEPTIAKPTKPTGSSEPSTTVAAATPKPTPEPKMATAPTLPPKPEAKPPASVSQTALLDADMLEEDEEDLDFTAESLLAQQLYIAELKRWSYKYLTYPRRALERSWEGNVRLSITIDRSGEVTDLVIIEEAKHGTLTKAAEKAVRKASPFPAVPKDIAGKQFSFTLPIVFKLKN